MHEDKLLELVGLHKETAPPLLVAKFDFTSDKDKKEKAQASLYDKYILIKIKVFSYLFRKTTRRHFTRSSSPLTSFSL